MRIDIPADVQYIIDTLEGGGYEAYAVGGCVRDSLLGNAPKDWDICTSALPGQIKECFEGQHIIDTGLKHGTVTLMLGHKPFEITTYRVDGKYTDGRRPDEVRFVNVLKRDLARRDFTINAMAYNPKTGLADYYAGRQDLAEGIIKCVGNPGKRFREDALRIMRAMRFASEFGFSVESGTAQAMLENKKLLANIAPERISAELNKLLLGDGADSVLSAHIGVIAEIIPELAAVDGFEQNNPYHCHDVLAHTLRSIGNAPKDAAIRLALLLHDIGKPECHTLSEDGTSHFYGHAQRSSDMARDILRRLKYDNETVRTVTELVALHDREIGSTRSILRLLNKTGADGLRRLFEVQRADAMAKSDKFKQEKLPAQEEAFALAEEIIEQRMCFSLKDLAVGGRDLIDAGIAEGAAIGEILKKLLDMVMDGQAVNDKDELLRIAEDIYRA